MIFIEPVSAKTKISKNSKNDDNNEKYQKSGLKSDKAETYVTRLEAYMREAKPYLDGDLTMKDLAVGVGIPSYHLTQILNENLMKNFYDYINEYRVEEVKRHLQDESYRNDTLISIAFDTGFNSKSAFNRIFKKVTNDTPSQFRKRHCS
jgi:AraC-like DNA-binding protein